MSELTNCQQFNESCNYAQLRADLATIEKTLEEQLAAAQATIAQMREALEMATAFREGGTAIARKVLAIPANLDALHEDRARECDRLADRYDLGFKIGSYLREEAAAHRAKKESK